VTSGLLRNARSLSREFYKGFELIEIPGCTLSAARLCKFASYKNFIFANFLSLFTHGFVLFTVRPLSLSAHIIFLSLAADDYQTLSVYISR